MPPDSVFVVRSGPRLDRLKSVPPAEKWKCGRRYLVGYVGVIGKQEGIDYLLRSVRYLVFDKRRVDTHFVVMGSGPSLQDAQRYATQIGVSEFVTFTGRVPDEELLEALSTADVCVNPDVANEMNDKSTMNKVMEYMALGKPIVQFDLAEGRFSARDSSLYARKNDEIDFARRSWSSWMPRSAAARWVKLARTGFATSSNGDSRPRSSSRPTMRCSETTAEGATGPPAPSVPPESGLCVASVACFPSMRQDQMSA